MDRIRRGFRLVGASWSVVKTDRELLVLPVISFACMIAVGAVLGGAAWAIGLPGQGQSLSAGQYLILAAKAYKPTGKRPSSQLFQQGSPAV